MKLIEPSVELISYKNPYKAVEAIGRTCYKSEDKITKDSFKTFCTNMWTRQHFAMLEHGTATFVVEGIPDLTKTLYQIPYLVITKLGDGFNDSYLITASLSHLYKPYDDKLPRDAIAQNILQGMKDLVKTYYFEEDDSCNFGSLFDGLCTISLVEDLKSIQDKYPEHPILEKHQFMTMKFTCDRGVSHELVRHRCSVAQSSTRYCDYSKGKFGSEITFVKPAEYDSWPEEHKKYFEDFLQNCEETYMWMRDKGYQPQQARAVLPNALMTEVILTMPAWQWAHFINLRYYGVTGNPHPDMKIVAKKAEDIFEHNFLGGLSKTEDEKDEATSKDETSMSAKTAATESDGDSQEVTAKS